jgi:hypothetical protein
MHQRPEAFERAFNSLLAGNDILRVRARTLPPGATWHALAGMEEPEDFAVRAEAFAKLIPLGVVSPTAAARLLHLPRPEPKG